MRPKHIILLILVAICFESKITFAQQQPCDAPRFIELYDLGKAQLAKKDYANAIKNLDIAGRFCPHCSDCQTMIAACKKAVAAATAQAKENEKQRLNKADIEMVYVKGGSFEMGSNEGNDDEKPILSVRVGSFYMGKYEVTQAQWRAVMGNNPSYFKNCANCPVEQVSWNDVQKFIKKLNAQIGKNYRLPTEAEWEYAAGGGSRNRTRFGNARDILDPAEANFNASADHKTAYSVVGEVRGKTTAVGSFRANALGLYDMSGNVWEWCADWYKGYAGSTGVTDDTGSFRVIRGGGWGYIPRNSRVAYRASDSLMYHDYCLGFRLVSPQ
jgi:formylglycine-generating enzyme required for sulfatase activity